MFQGFLGWLDAAIVQGTVVALIGLVALLLCRRAVASTRHLVAGSILVCALALTFFNLSPIRTPMQGAVRSPLINAKVIEQTPVAVVNTVADVPRAEFDRGMSHIPLELVVGILYVSVIGALLVRLGHGVLWARRRRAKSAPADERMCKIAHMAAVSVGLYQTPHLGMCASIQTPMALGGLRPTVLLPQQAVDWEDARLRSILEHEMAHIKRGDCHWQFLACIACALYWFNPLIWLLKRAMVDAAEQAADDAVILGGAKPSEYASSLLETAKMLTAKQRTVVAVPLFRSQNLKARIQSILSSERRGKLQPSATFMSVVIGTTLAAMCVAGFAQDGREMNPTSWAKDVREGKTAPGNPSNDFKGTLRDGRKVEIYQLAQRLANGTIVYWKPDGTILTPKEATPVKFPKDNNLTLRVVSLRAQQKQDSTDPMLTLSTGNYGPDQPSEVLYAGGGMLASKDGYSYSNIFIGAPKEDGTYFSFTAELTDDPWTSEAEIDPSGKMNDNSNRYSNPKLTYLKSETSKDITYWARGYTGPYVVVEFFEKTWEHDTSSQVAAVDKQGKPLSLLDPNFGSQKGSGFANRWYIKASQSQLGKVLIQRRTVYTCEMNGIRVRPNIAP